MKKHQVIQIQDRKYLVCNSYEQTAELLHLDPFFKEENIFIPKITIWKKGVTFEVLNKNTLLYLAHQNHINITEATKAFLNERK